VIERGSVLTVVSVMPTVGPDEGVVVRGRRTRNGGRAAPMLALAAVLLLVFAAETARELADVEPGQGVIFDLVSAVAEGLLGAYIVTAVALVVGGMVYLSAHLRGGRRTFPEAISDRAVVLAAAVAALLVVFLS
jgi:hypothetical protein